MLKFEMDEQESERATKYIKEHDKTCKIKNSNVQPAIGGRITYTFTPTGLGMACGVMCDCGWSKECTNVDHW